MGMSLFELKKERQEQLNTAEAQVAQAEKAGRGMSTMENAVYDSSMAAVNEYNTRIAAIEAKNTLAYGDNSISSIAFPNRNGNGASSVAPGPKMLSTKSGAPAVHTNEPAEASNFRGQFAAWMNSGLTRVESGRRLSPAMEAAGPSGPISVGEGSGLDSIGFTVPSEILPYLASYYALDSFGLAGATVIQTDHLHPMNQPVISAGASDTVYAENAAPTGSQPFGLSGFTFGGTKYSRQVLASYESLMSSELPLQGVILDELLASTATTLTQAVTTSFVSALTAPPGTTGASPLLVSDDSIYDSIVSLRFAISPRFDTPRNVFMLSRATLAKVRKAKASTSGVPLFDPTSNTLFDRPYVLNDYLDTAAGAGVGFIAYGSFADGVWIRRTGLMTRVFLELFAQQGQIGYRATQWQDQHFLAELAGAAQPPTFQPIYYANVASE